MTNFRIDCTDGQNVMSFLPQPGFADVRLFMRGSMLDGTDGLAGNIYPNIGSIVDNSLPLIAPKQTHCVRVLRPNDASKFPKFDMADAILLTEPGIIGSLRFADCAPLLIMPSEEWARENSPWLLIAHSGYKGTVQNIASAALDEIKKEFGKGAAESSSAWIGPCIGGESYPRTMEEWTELGLRTFHNENVREADGHYYFDIGAEIRHQLIHLGIKHVYLCGMDTMRNPELCYSYRAGEKHDRMFLYARLKTM